MKNQTEPDRLTLGLWPTPLHALPALSRELGCALYIKRDDMSGVMLGGNKVRKLEYLLADAKKKGADYVLTTGGAQSNHALLTAACAGKLGMRAVLVLKKRGQYARKGNQVLYDLAGADVRLMDTDDYADIYAEMERMADALRAEGHIPYCIPVGGSTALGSLGYVACAREIAAQAAAQGLAFDRVVCATGSGGTHAGLALGAALALPGVQVTGVAVDSDPFAQIVPALIRQSAALLGLSDAPAVPVQLHDMTGPGYAVPSEAGLAAMRLMAEREGIVLDPVYTGKAFAGLIELRASGGIRPGERVLFLHSGGAGGLFAYEL